MSKPTTLVTGAAGFIGSHLTKALQKEGHQVVALDDLSGGFKKNLPQGVCLIEGSVNDHLLVECVFKDFQIDYVYHAAAYAAEGLSHFIRRHNYQNNLIGSVNLINASIRCSVKCFVFFSSIAVYGRGQVPLDEETIPRPEDPYGISKLSVELDLAAAHDLFGLPYVIFRPHNVYGEFQNLNDQFRNVVGIFSRQLLLGQPLTIFGDGSQRRAFTYVKDILPACVACLNNTKSHGQVFNLGSDTPTTVLQLANLLIQISGMPCSIKHLPERHEVIDAFSSHKKAEAFFGSFPKTTLEEGIEKTWSWAKTQKISLRPLPFEVEVAQNLPPSWAKLLKP